jgi:hypothetical protein
VLTESKRSAISPWVPMWFCAALCLITLVAQFAIMVINRKDSIGAWPIVFLCNLPMCFFFVGSAVVGLQREITDLRSQLSELQKKAPS